MQVSRLEFRDELVKLYLESGASKTVSHVARENSVGAETGRYWVKAYEAAHPEEEEPLGVSEHARLPVVGAWSWGVSSFQQAAAFFVSEHR